MLLKPPWGFGGKIPWMVRGTTLGGLGVKPHGWSGVKPHGCSGVKPHGCSGVKLLVGSEVKVPGI